MQAFLGVALHGKTLIGGYKTHSTSNLWLDQLEPSSTRSGTTSSDIFRYMIQYIRLKQMKLTGKRIRLYLSMSEGLTPPIFCKFFLQWSIGGTWWSISSLALLAIGPERPLPSEGRRREALPRPAPRLSKGSCIFIRIS